MSIITPFSIFKEELQKVEVAIKNIVEDEDCLFSKLAKESLFAGGKRIRPMLFILAEKLTAEKKTPDSEVVASCFELLHVASLLHDDVIDEARLRRGKPALNTTLGNNQSILVGDYLLVNALESLLTPEFVHFMPLALATLKDMIKGEGLELENNCKIDITIEESLKTNRLKTAVLFANACKAGAIIGKANEDEVAALTNFGMNLGIVFQLVDDVLDYTSNEQILGKPVFNDFCERKPTIPLILAFQESSEDEKEFLKNQFTTAQETEIKQERIYQIMNKYDVFNKTLNIAKDYLDKATKEIQIFNKSDIHEALKELSDFVLTRTN